MPTETKEQILDAAEALFAQQGIDAVSMRQITTAAGVNLAAVNYHFGSKEALVKAVFGRRVEILNRIRLEELDRYEREAGDGPLPVENVLRAMFEPAIRLTQESGGRTFMRICGRLYAESAEFMQEMFEEWFRDLIQRFFSAFHRALPELPPKELAWRVHFGVGAMVHTMMDGDKLKKFSQGMCDPADVEGTVERMVHFVAAGMKAPVREQAQPESVAVAEEALV